MREVFAIIVYGWHFEGSEIHHNTEDTVKVYDGYPTNEQIESCMKEYNVDGYLRVEKRYLPKKK